MSDKAEFSEGAQMMAWLRGFWKLGPAPVRNWPAKLGGEAVRLPPHLYMRRKTFELGPETLHKVEDQLEPHLKAAGAADKSQVQQLNLYWAREHALYETLCASNRYTYEEFLPGRAYSYQCLARIVTSLPNVDNCSIVDVGCGSAVLSRFVKHSGNQYVGADVSMAALNFAQTIASDGGVQFAPVQAEATSLPFLDRSFDISVSLGLLEHFDIPIQLDIVAEAARVTRSYVVIAVPNTASPIFRVMCCLEASMAGAMGFPLEEHYYEVDFSKIAEFLNLQLYDYGAFHIPPPAYLDRFAAPQEKAFFRKVVRAAKHAYQGSASDAWWSVERRISKSERDKYGWFSYGIFRHSG